MGICLKCTVALWVCLTKLCQLVWPITAPDSRVKWQVVSSVNQREEARQSSLMARYGTFVRFDSID